MGKDIIKETIGGIITINEKKKRFLKSLELDWDLDLSKELIRKKITDAFEKEIKELISNPMFQTALDEKVKSIMYINKYKKIKGTGW